MNDGRASQRNCRAAVLSAVLAAGAQIALPTPASHADAVAYLVDVTVRHGYNFPDGDSALAYGRGLCDQVQTGRSYAELMSAVQSDFDTSDDFQASYLIAQAVNELCPAQIWQLRQSAAGYHPVGMP
jgi:hypothetical protein